MSVLAPAGMGQTLQEAMEQVEVETLFAEALDNESVLLAICMVAGQTAGFISAELQDYEDDLLPGPYLTIEFVETAQGYEGRGIARALISLAEEFARTKGARSIDLLVWHGNERARGLYEYLDYEPIEIRMAKLI